MNLIKFFAHIFIVACWLPHQYETAKILALFPFPGRSQYIFAEPYLKALAAKGHEVTVINTYPLEQKIKNFNVIAAVKIHEIYYNILQDYKPDMRLWKQLNFFTSFFERVCLNVFENAEVQELLQSGKKFDLFITETLQTEPLFGLAQHFGAKIIGMSSFGTDWHIDNLMGNTSPISYNPPVSSPRTSRMTFYERLQNLVEITIEHVHKYFVHLPHMKGLYEKHFPNAKTTFSEVQDSFSLMLLNQHYSIGYPRPYVPNMIEVAGVHISSKRRPLPADLQRFIDEATNGVIYFSMGSNVRSKDLPEETLEVLLKAFGSLKQRVIWKFENDEIKGKPENVFIGKWFAQPDILAQPNVKLFITHGGLLSTIETIYFAKPLLGLPVFYDQFLNVKSAVRMGYGLELDLNNLKLEDFTSAIQKLLNQETFTQRATYISKIFHDQREEPMERAIWWTEYILRHDGARHLRGPARDLNFLQLHSLDTIFVLIAGLVIVAVFVLGLITRIWRHCFSPKHLRMKDKLKKQK